jgi:hypothetical protein
MAMVNVQIQVERETEKAVLTNKGWMPKSQITIDDRGLTVTGMAEWLYRKTFQVDHDRNNEFVRGIPETKPQAQPSFTDLAIGVYRVPETGTIYVVKPNREKTRLYAKRLEQISGNRLTHSDEVVNWKLVYESGAIYKLKPEYKMSYDDAREWSIRFNHCIICGRFLKDAQSVAEGIGPVCAESVYGIKRKRTPNKRKSLAWSTDSKAIHAQAQADPDAYAKEFHRDLEKNPQMFDALWNH